MKLQDLETAKQIIAEMIKSKKALDKAVTRRGEIDSFSVTRASATTMDANIHKNYNCLHGYLPHLEEVVRRLK